MAAPLYRQPSAQGWHDSTNHGRDGTSYTTSMNESGPTYDAAATTMQYQQQQLPSTGCVASTSSMTTTGPQLDSLPSFHAAYEHPMWPAMTSPTYPHVAHHTSLATAFSNHIGSHAMRSSNNDGDDILPPVQGLSHQQQLQQQSNHVSPPQSSHPFELLQQERKSASQHAASTSSPRSDHGWRSNASSDSHDFQQANRELLSPLMHDNPPRLRSDGIRKKNARFAIPENRKVETIDGIIQQCDPNDESLLKELKQQKRLLRNRQAALDSRCRKKEHTQKLEETQKALVSHLECVEEKLAQHQHREAAWFHERAQWQEMVDTLVFEKEELVRVHTLETAELRKKNSILLEDAERRLSVPTTVPMSAGYSSNVPDFDHLSMDDSPSWDDFSFIGSNTSASAATVNPGHIHQHGDRNAMAPRIKTETEMDDQHGRRLDQNLSLQQATPGQASGEEKGVASGILLMLLLCGAWVASRGNAATTSVPHLPAEIRAASATILNSVYRDAGMTDAATTLNPSQLSVTRDTYHTAGSTSQLPQHSFPALVPTRQQQRDEAFGLSTAQYNAITSDDAHFGRMKSPIATSSPAMGPRRNLREALTAMQSRSAKSSTASEMYVRSLMWDELSPEVVREFARMVAETNAEPMH